MAPGGVPGVADGAAAEGGGALGADGAGAGARGAVVAGGTGAGAVGAGVGAAGVAGAGVAGAVEVAGGAVVVCAQARTGAPAARATHVATIALYLIEPLRIVPVASGHMALYMVRAAKITRL